MMKKTAWLAIIAMVVAAVMLTPAFPGVQARRALGAGEVDGMTWGTNGNGELGNGGAPDAGSSTPVQVSGLTDVATLEAGILHDLAAKNDGSVWAWGWNNSGQLGDGSANDRNVPVQVKGPGGSGNLTGVVAVDGGSAHSLALKGDGSVWAWGGNWAGQLGNGGTNDSYYPVQVKGQGGTGNLTGVVAVAAGYHHSIALKNDGSVWAWGYNEYGQLGNDTKTSSSTPVQVKGPGGSGYLTGVVAVATGSIHSLALKSDGSAWAWGWNFYGQLGDGGFTDSLTPLQVKGPGGAGNLTGVVALAAGSWHNLAAKSDGSLWAWGYNEYGQLGNDVSGPGAYSNTPAQVKGVGGVDFLADVVAVAGGSRHSLAVKSDGSVWAWGFNAFGQLGDGDTTDTSTPVQVKGPGGSGNLSGAVTVSGGEAHSLCLTPHSATINEACICPTSGNVGTTLFIIGSNFGTCRGSSYVTVGGINVSTYCFWSHSRVAVKVPAGASRASGVVVHVAGLADSNSRTFKVLPRADSVSPASGKIGSKVTVSGNAFGASKVSGSYVKFGGKYVSTYYSWDDDEIVVKVPCEIFGKQYVRVTTTGGTSSGKTFKVIPQITSVSPTSNRRGSSVTIRGHAFGPKRYSGSYVRFGGKYVSTYSYWSDDRIVLLVPAAPYAACYVKVTTIGGTSNGKVFTVKR